jgi:hypothetical protein
MSGRHEYWQESLANECDSRATLASLLAHAASGLRLNEHIEADGPDVFHHACKMGLEGIVSKRKDRQIGLRARILMRQQ